MDRFTLKRNYFYCTYTNKRTFVFDLKIQKYTRDICCKEVRITFPSQTPGIQVRRQRED